MCFSQLLHSKFGCLFALVMCLSPRTVCFILIAAVVLVSSFPMGLLVMLIVELGVAGLVVEFVLNRATLLVAAGDSRI